MAELERAKLRMAEQTWQRVQAEANAQPTRRRRVDDPVDGARCTKGPGQERHTSTESRSRSIDVSEGSASENGLCAW